MSVKKQTWWLVVMLGLMVVLSGYYWWTEDAVPQLATTTVPATGGQPVIDSIVDAGVEGRVSLEGSTSEPPNPEAMPAPLSDPKKEDGKTTEAKPTPPKDDEAVLQQLTTTPTGAEAVTALQMSRTSHVSQQLERLTAQMADADASDAAIAEASAKHDALMDRESMMIALEENLMQQYEHIVVTHDEKAQQYTVHVHANSLSRTQAANLMTAAIDRLQLSPHQITIQWIR